MSEPTTAACTWDDDTGSIVIGSGEPLGPGLTQMFWLTSGLTVEADGMDPDRLLGLSARAEGDEATHDLDLLGTLLAVDPATVSLARTTPGLTVPVVGDRWSVLARLASAGAGHQAAAALGPPSPWWAVEALVLARRLGSDAVFAAVAAALRCEPSAVVDEVLAGSWTTVGGAADAARSAIDDLARLTGRDGSALRLRIAAERPPRSSALEEPGILPTDLVAGEPRSLAVSPVDVRPGMLDLRAGVTVELDDDGFLLIGVLLAEGAYVQDALAHRAILERTDIGLIVADAGMEPTEPTRIGAALRVSRHTLGRPLLLRLVHESRTAVPGDTLAEVVAARTLALAGASAARLGDLPGASALLGRSAARWRALGEDDRADAAALDRVRADVAPLLSESIDAAPE